MTTVSSTLGKPIDFRIFDKLDLAANENHLVYFDLLASSECVNHEELYFLLSYLQERHWIQDYNKNNREQRCVLTVRGHARLAELERVVPESSKVFIAMWFNPEMTEAYEKGIAPAIKEAGYEPVRIDRKNHLNKIDDEIISEIRRARFVVADFTHGEEGVRGGVYYEAGFAHGLQIPVIFTCHENMIDKIHFDTRQYNHILWKASDDLHNQLVNRITATIGDGPLKSADP